MTTWSCSAAQGLAVVAAAEEQSVSCGLHQVPGHLPFRQAPEIVNSLHPVHSAGLILPPASLSTLTVEA